MGGWSAHMSLNNLHDYCPWWPEEGTGYSRNDIIGGCDLPCGKCTQCT